MPLGKELIKRNTTSEQMIVSVQKNTTNLED